jgi:hypothetical protein
MPAQLRKLVVMLLAKVTALEQLVVEQRAEIARLKGLKGPPDIKPSGMDTATEPAKPGWQKNRPRRGKVRPRVSVEDHVLKAAAPVGSRFKGYETYLVQDLVLSVRAIRYLRERWVTPDGQTIVAPLPEGTKGHFGPDLRRFVLMQYHQACPCEGGGPVHAAPSGSTVAFGRRVDLQARDPATVNGKAGGLPRRSPRGAAHRIGDVALGIGRRHRRTP